MKSKKMTVSALLIAMCAILGTISIDLGNIKITLESVPIILCGLLFGPIEGMIVGFLGTFIYQLLRYGLSVTTLLWILPYVICGLLVGQYSKSNGYNINRKQMIFIVVVTELIVTSLNTFAMYIDSKIFGYYSYAYIFGSVIIRYISCILKSVIFANILPKMVNILKDKTIRLTEELKA